MGDIRCLSCFSQVVFVKKPKAFLSLPYQQFPCEKKHDIYFGDEQIYAQYRYCSVLDFMIVLPSGILTLQTQPPLFKCWFVFHYQGND